MLKAVILAGGQGTRLAPYTTILPKPLMPLHDMPVAEVVVRQLKRAGIRDITFAVGYLSSLVQAYFGNGRKWGVRIRYSEEGKPLGTAGPLARISDLRSTFVVMNGDILTTLDLKAMVRFHRKRRAVATLGMFRKAVPIDLGIVDTDSQGWVHGYTEKPTLHYNISMGIYVMEPSVLKYLRPGLRIDLPDLVRVLVRNGLPVQAYPFAGVWLDIGRQEDYLKAVTLFEKNRTRFVRP